MMKVNVKLFPPSGEVETSEQSWWWVSHPLRLQTGA